MEDVEEQIGTEGGSLLVLEDRLPTKCPMWVCHRGDDYLQQVHRCIQRRSPPWGYRRQ